MEFTIYTKAEVAAMIENGIPENTTVYYFNPSVKVGVNSYIQLIPIEKATFDNITGENAGFLGITTTE